MVPNSQPDDMTGRDPISPQGLGRQYTDLLRELIRQSHDGIYVETTGRDPISNRRLDVDMYGTPHGIKVVRHELEGEDQPEK